MARERLYRMTEIQRNMLVVALMDEYRKQKARGVPYRPSAGSPSGRKMRRGTKTVCRGTRKDCMTCALPGFVDSKNEEKTERNAGYLVVSQSGGGMLRQGTREGIRRTPANRGMRAHRIVKGLDISEDVCHGMCP